MDSSSSSSGDEMNEIQRIRRWLTFVIGVSAVLLLGSLVLNVVTSGAVWWLTNAIAFPAGIAVGTLLLRLNYLKHEGDRPSGDSDGEDQ